MKISYIIFVYMVIFHASSFAQQDVSKEKFMQTITIVPGASVTLQANSKNALSYQWFKDGNTIAKATKEKYTVTGPGIYSVIAINQTCSSEVSQGIIVMMSETQLLTADLAIIKTSESKQLQINDPFEYQLNISNNGASKATMVTVEDILPDYMVFDEVIASNIGTAVFDAATHTINWKIDQLEKGASAQLKIRVKVTQGGTIENTATVKAHEQDINLADNKSTDRREIETIKVPNVITPNGDGLNDQLRIDQLDGFVENELTIINRWGNHVYDKKNYKNDWTGEGLDEGTYYYLLKVKNASGNWQIFKGYVMLLRSVK